ncbi:MAG: gliding motility protein GldM [Cytophagales bacterium]
MAGGKETPRQKLIGIMYLILLALLALQVSSAIMEKFKFLDDSLAESNAGAESSADKMLASIKKTAAESGNRDIDKKFVNTAEKIRQSASAIKKEIEDVRKAMIDKTGGLEDPNDPKSMYKGAKAEGEIEDLMFAGGANSRANQLKKKINAWTAELAEITGEAKTEYPDLALDGKDDKRISDKEQKKKDYAELNFTHTPMVASMAMMNELKSNIIKYETKALNKIAAQMGAVDIKFDKVEAFASAESKIVAAGAKYKADIFLTASSSVLTPTVRVNGRDIKVENGKGKYEVTAMASNFDANNLAKTSYSAEVTVKFNGKDTTFKQKIEYQIAKPVIQVSAGDIGALYRNCGNKLNIDVPALGASYQPSFRGEGTAIESVPGSKSQVILVPSATECKVFVSSGGQNIGNTGFKVRLAPKPTVMVSTNGTTAADIKNGLSKNSLRTLKVIAVAEEGFKRACPNDARYNVAQVEVILKRGRRAIKGPQNGTGANLGVGDFVSSVAEGDALILDVKSVKRANYKNQIEDARFDNSLFVVPLY